MAVTEELRKMINEDIDSLKEALSDVSNTKTLEYAKLELYKDITARYHLLIPKFGDGLYGYYPDAGFYDDDIAGMSLYHNLRQIYNKLQTVKATGYQTLISTRISGQRNSDIIFNANYSSQNTNSNNIEINNSICITFDHARQQIENMASFLSNTEIEEIFNKINRLEQIAQSSEHKTKKWKNANEIIKWIADKGVDVGIALLPLLLQIK